MIENFAIGVVYGVCISTISSLIGYVVYCIVQLIKGSADDK